jgi:NADP-dependent 3-hydroxy acid dehydrogenase YdfG
MSKTLQDRVALVTGGAQGLGKAISHRLSSKGLMSSLQILIWRDPRK